MEVHKCHFSFDTLPLKCGLIQRLKRRNRTKYNHKEVQTYLILWSDVDFAITGIC